MGINGNCPQECSRVCVNGIDIAADVTEEHGKVCRSLLYRANAHGTTHSRLCLKRPINASSLCIERVNETSICATKTLPATTVGCPYTDVAAGKPKAHFSRSLVTAAGDSFAALSVCIRVVDRSGVHPFHDGRSMRLVIGGFVGQWFFMSLASPFSPAPNFLAAHPFCNVSLLLIREILRHRFHFALRKSEVDLLWRQPPQHGWRRRLGDFGIAVAGSRSSFRRSWNPLLPRQPLEQRQGSEELPAGTLASQW